MKSLRKHSPKLAPVLSWSRGVSRERKRPWRGSVEADPVPPAGALFGTRRLTEDGLEHTFALNHMSYFVVTEGLRGSRIVNTASAAHQGALWMSTIFNPRKLQSHEGL